MFNLSQEYAPDKPILKYDYNRYTQAPLILVNGEKIQSFIDIPRENSANSLEDNYHGLDFHVTHRVGADARYADGDHKSLVNLGPIAVFIKYRLGKSIGKKKREIDKAHDICLMYKLISSCGDSGDFSIGFHRSIEARARASTNNRTTKGNYRVRNYNELI